MLQMYISHLFQTFYSLKNQNDLKFMCITIENCVMPKKDDTVINFDLVALNFQASSVALIGMIFFFNNAENL
jgi:hypothetical protein